jgi:ABC-2 type transport system permease protein
MTALRIRPPAAPPPAFRALVRSEFTLARRYPVPVLFALGLPLLLLVIFGSIPATTKPNKALDGHSFFNVYVPTLMVVVVMVLGLISLPGPLAAYRHQGVLRRMSTTPVHPSWLLAAQLVLNLVLAVTGIALIVAVGVAAFGLVFPQQFAGYLLTVMLTIGALFGVGLCVAAIAGTPQLANGIGAACFYPLAFLSGLYVPVSTIHSSLVHTLSQAVPTGAAVNAFADSVAGRFPSADSLLVLLAWALLSGVAAVRLFRWE